MIVLDLHCPKAHRFEGWFASAAAFEDQLARGLLSCPTCGATEIRRLPSAPYVQTGHTAVPAPPAAVPAVSELKPAPVEALARLVGQLRSMARGAEDVGERLPEEARRIHYGETDARDIRGSASRDEVEALLGEGIVVLPVPPGEGELH
jgi:hypothetical protein